MTSSSAFTADAPSGQRFSQPTQLSGPDRLASTGAGSGLWLAFVLGMLALSGAGVAFRTRAALRRRR